jgi:hypothetical protein
MKAAAVLIGALMLCAPNKGYAQKSNRWVEIDSSDFAIDTVSIIRVSPIVRTWVSTAFMNADSATFVRRTFHTEVNCTTRQLHILSVQDEHSSYSKVDDFDLGASPWVDIAPQAPFERVYNYVCAKHTARHNSRH